MYRLPFGEVNADKLPLDLGANDVGVVRNHRADTAEIDRNVMLGDNPTPVAEVPLVALEAVEEAGILGRAWDAIRLWIK